MNQPIAYQQYKINYHLEGNGELLVFLHGWPTNSVLWKFQIEILKKNYRTLAFDWLGFGKSDKPVDHHYTFTNQKDILDTVLADLLKSDEKVNIIAHDIGGPPAILWASENQERVKRLILLNTVIYPFSTSLDKVSHLFFKVPIIKELLVSPFGLRQLMKTLSRNRDSGVKDRINEILQAHENVKNEIRLKTILEPLNEGKKKEFLVLANLFSTMNVNRYLIIAKNDPLCYRHIKKLGEDNPDIPAYSIDHCGHFIPLDKPAELNEILIKILAN